MAAAKEPFGRDRLNRLPYLARLINLHLDQDRRPAPPRSSHPLRRVHIMWQMGQRSGLASPAHLRRRDSAHR